MGGRRCLPHRLNEITNNNSDNTHMKKTLLISTACTLILSACGSSKGNESYDTDSIYIAPAEEVAAAIESSTGISYITKDSIGHIFIGMPMHEVPDSIPTLYTHKENGASEDAVTITFLDGGKEKFIAYDFGEGNIDVLNVIGSNVKVKGPQDEFGLGDKFDCVLSLPGVETEWSGYDGAGSWYWVWNGLWFAPSQESLTETLSKSLYNYDSAPTPSDFSEDVAIGFIGTGLPF